MPDTDADAEALAVGVKALLATAALHVPVFDADEVPGTNNRPGPRPEEWVEVGLTRTAGGAYRTSGVTGTASYYLTTGVAARTSTNRRRLEQRIRASIEGVRVAPRDKDGNPAGPAGLTSTPVRFYANDGADYVRDWGLSWSLTSWSLTL